MIVLYDMQLVALSVIIAIIGSLAALAMASATRWSNADRHTKLMAISNGAIVIGSGIWSMHFIAMMAVQFPVLVNFNPLETVLSLLLAILVAGTGLFIASGDKASRWRIPIGGVFMGLGIAGMHYLGMAAIAGCGIAYDVWGVVLSIGLAIGASMAALWFTFETRGVILTIIGGVIMGLAISSMHYTAMFATHFLPIRDAVFLSEPLLSQHELAYLIASASVFICTVNMIILAIARFGRAGRAG